MESQPGKPGSKPRLGPVGIAVIVAFAAGVTVIGILVTFQPRPTSDVSILVACQWGIVYGHTVQSYIVTGNSTIVTGTFNPIGTLTTAVTVTGYPAATVGAVTTVTTQAYPPAETCAYVSG